MDVCGLITTCGRVDLIREDNFWVDSYHILRYY